MHQRIGLLVVAFMIACVIGSSVATAAQVMTANIPFKFLAGGKVHDPGKYELTIPDDEATLTLVPAKGASSLVPVLTRLAEPVPSPSSARLVFDKIGDTYYLSEAWMPGFDGFATHMTKAKHVHEAVPLDKKAH